MVSEVEFGNAVYTGKSDAFDGFNVLFGRCAPFGCQRIRPDVGQAGDGVPLKLGLSNLTPNGRGDQILRHALLGIVRKNATHLVNRTVGVRFRGQNHYSVAYTGLRVGFRHSELRRQGLPRRYHSIKVGTLAGQHVGENLAGRIIR